MTLAQTIYRVRQFWRAIDETPSAADLEEARRWLSKDQWALFLRLQPSDQAHSLRVFRGLQDMVKTDAGIDQTPLFVAALLHDVGKVCYPLRIWERVLIVLAQALIPGMVRKWGREEVKLTSTPDISTSPFGWRRAFVVAIQHPEWGARLAAEAGAPVMAVNLIRRHQNLLNDQAVSIEERLLMYLQRVDQNN